MSTTVLMLSYKFNQTNVKIRMSFHEDLFCKAESWLMILVENVFGSLFWELDFSLRRCFMDNEEN